MIIEDASTNHNFPTSFLTNRNGCAGCLITDLMIDNIA